MDRDNSFGSLGVAVILYTDDTDPSADLHGKDLKIRENLFCIREIRVPKILIMWPSGLAFSPKIASCILIFGVVYSD